MTRAAKPQGANARLSQKLDACARELEVLTVANGNLSGRLAAAEHRTGELEVQILHLEQRIALLEVPNA